MRNPWVNHNTPCLACGAYKPKFVRFGALPFCDVCFDLIFKNVTINEEKDRYGWWLKVYLLEEKANENHMEAFKNEYEYKYGDTPKTTRTDKCGTCCCGQSVTAD